MKKIIITLVIIGMFGYAVYDLVYQSDKTDTIDTNVPDQEEFSSTEGEEQSKSATGLSEGNVAPDFQLTTLEGKQVRLSDYRGQRVMLNFWASWCPPCRAEMPDMEKFHQNTEVVILAVNLTQTESDPQNVEDFVQEFGLSFPILLDKDVKVAGKYQIRPIPTTYMIDSTGKIRHKSLGAMNYEQMVQEFEKMK